MFSYVFLALLGAAAATNVICSDYTSGGGGGGGGGGGAVPKSYYVRPIPQQCIGEQGDAKGWKPTFRIKETNTECPEGWKKYKKSYYFGQKEKTFREFKFFSSDF